MNKSNGMKSLSWASRFPSRLLGSRRLKPLLNAVIRLEGGPMTSTTLRRVLADNSDIHVGPFSYGSLLDAEMCDSRTSIGAYCSIGKNVRRYGAAHPLESGSTHPYFYNPALGYAKNEDDVERTGISIGSDVWIGSNVTILPGCSYIGFGAVIGAGSVITKDVPDFAIVVGNPARVIRFRHSEQRRLAILRSKFWELPPLQAQEVLKSLC